MAARPPSPLQKAEAWDPEGGQDPAPQGHQALRQREGKSRKWVKIKIKFESAKREVESSPYMASRSSGRWEVVSSAGREGRRGLGFTQCERGSDTDLGGQA